MTESLLRQRRSLLLSGAAILLLALGDVDIQKVSILGADFNFKKNINVLYGAIWVVWSYFLYRYLTYFFYEDLRIFKKIKADTFEEIINPKIKNYVNSLYQEPNDNCSYSYYGVVSRGMIYHGQVYHDKINEIGESYKDIENIQLDFNPVWRMRAWQTIAWLNFLFVKPAITDYLFPIMFSTLAISVGLIAEWPGNIFNLLT